MTKIEFKTHPDFPLQIPDTREEVLALLDKYFPNITDKIDVDKLNMSSAMNCVLGQTIGWNKSAWMFHEIPSYKFSGMFTSGTPEWKQAVIDYRAKKAKAAPKFDLKTQPWFIKTETPEKYVAAQEWLFSKGLVWRGGDNWVSEYYRHYLTNVTLESGEIEERFMRGDHISPKAQEIKLTYKTTVTDVEWPTSTQTKADKLRAKIAKLQAKLEELEK